MNRNFALTLLFLGVVSFAFGQITVDTVQLTETVDKRYVSQLPRVRDASGGVNQAVAKINAAILDLFMINSYYQSELEEFRWYDVEFHSEVKEGIVFIAFAGEYYGAYPSYVEEELFFSASTGEKLTYLDIPFQALFSLDGYLTFMQRFWLPVVKNEFKEAIECADSEPYCSYYDVSGYSVDGNKFSMSLTNDCYPRVIRACAPSASLTLSVDSLTEYLSDQGRKILFEDTYTAKIGVDKLLYNRAIANDIPKNVFLFGKINGKYPFSMALTIDNSFRTVDGCYYYDNKWEKLTLTGLQLDEVSTELEESVGEKITGYFVLNRSAKYARDAFPVYGPGTESIYLSGFWSNPDRTKTYDIEFTAVKINKPWGSMLNPLE